MKRRDSHVAEDQQQAVKEAEELINKQGEDLIRFNVRRGRGAQSVVVAQVLFCLILVCLSYVVEPIFVCAAPATTITAAALAPPRKLAKTGCAAFT